MYGCLTLGTPSTSLGLKSANHTYSGLLSTCGLRIGVRVEIRLFTPRAPNPHSSKFEGSGARSTC